MNRAWHTEEWEVRQAWRVARRFHRAHGGGTFHPRAHFLYPAWRGVREVAGRLPADEDEARALAHVAGYRRCLDEWRDLTHGRRRRPPPRVISLGQATAGGGEEGATELGREDVPDEFRRRLSVWCEERRRRDRLPVRDRVWLYLWLVEGWSQAEVARAFGVWPSRVCAALASAAGVLRATTGRATA
jgi:DNA-directed RNA polymerase specialized sigma24 family protein